MILSAPPRVQVYFIELFLMTAFHVVDADIVTLINTLFLVIYTLTNEGMLLVIS